MIKKATPEDIARIAEFNRRMARESENFILDPDIALSGVKNLFNQPELGFYIVAQKESKIVGSLMITKEWSDWRNGIIWWIQSVYVLPDYRRKGLFREMYQYIRKMAVRQNISGLRLYVDKENLTALNTYQALGMTETDYKLFEDLF